jgi:DNA-binding MarR family transcriptional regulator
LSKKELTEEEYQVLMQVVNSGDAGILPEEIAEKLNMKPEKVEEILDSFEKRGLFYSEEEEN